MRPALAPVFATSIFLHRRLPAASQPHAAATLRGRLSRALQPLSRTNVFVRSFPCLHSFSFLPFFVLWCRVAYLCSSSLSRPLTAWVRERTGHGKKRSHVKEKRHDEKGGGLLVWCVLWRLSEWNNIDARDAYTIIILKLYEYAFFYRAPFLTLSPRGFFSSSFLLGPFRASRLLTRVVTTTIEWERMRW